MRLVPSAAIARADTSILKQYLFLMLVWIICPRALTGWAIRSLRAPISNSKTNWMSWHHEAMPRVSSQLMMKRKFNHADHEDDC
jgi:hypothetical protein